MQIFDDIQLEPCRTNYDTLQEALDKICQDADVTPWEVKSGSRRMDVVKIRRKFCRSVYPGIAYEKIGKFLNRHHSTIQHLVKNDN